MGGDHAELYLEGRVAFGSGRTKQDLAAGQLLYLSGEEPHSLHGVEDSTVLVTILLIAIMRIVKLALVEKIVSKKDGSDMASNQTSTERKLFCVGIFTNVTQANQAVAGLLRAGFDKDHITVICSNQAKEHHFRTFEHEHLTGADTPLAAAAGGVRQTDHCGAHAH